MFISSFGSYGSCFDFGAQVSRAFLTGGIILMLKCTVHYGSSYYRALYEPVMAGKNFKIS